MLVFTVIVNLDIFYHGLSNKKRKGHVHLDVGLLR